MKNHRLGIVFCTLLLSASPLLVYAEVNHDIAVAPAVIDEKGKARDIVNESITITNTSNHQISVYPSVNEVNVQAGEQGFQYAHDSSGLSASLSNWIELSRGMVQLGPGEKRTLPLIIRINENAVPNKYHALISFGDGDTRAEAEGKPPLATVTVNFEVQADIKEAMQLSKFTSDNVVFTGDDVLFKYQFQNIGNQDLQPIGEISIYDRNGQEVASIDVNKEGKSIAPNQLSQLASVWSASTGFGKFKALLTAKYGNSQTATVQDTIFFWIVPWKQIIAFFVASLLALIILGLYFNRWFEMRHLNKLAAAGALKPGVFEEIQNTPVPIIPITLPSLPEMPALPPVREVAERVQEHVREQVRQKRTLLSLFTRKGFVSIPAPLSKSMVEHSAIPEPTPTIGRTIDLKRMRPHADPVTPSDTHIINLKKNV